jgi:hypothetical protein
MATEALIPNVRSRWSPLPTTGSGTEPWYLLNRGLVDPTVALHFVQKSKISCPCQVSKPRSINGALGIGILIS